MQITKNSLKNICTGNNLFCAILLQIFHRHQNSCKMNCSIKHTAINYCAFENCHDQTPNPKADGWLNVVVAKGHLCHPFYLSLSNMQGLFLSNSKWKQMQGLYFDNPLFLFLILHFIYFIFKNNKQKRMFWDITPIFKLVHLYLIILLDSIFLKNAENVHKGLFECWNSITTV